MSKRGGGGILGIDVGLSGALALYRAGAWTLLDMPIVGDVCGWLREHQPDHAFVEFAAARPGQGVSSMFNRRDLWRHQDGAGRCGVPYTIVTPARWKAGVGIAPGSDKEASRLRALQLFPEQAAGLARKKDHARSDAMLIAFYGMGRAS